MLRGNFASITFMMLEGEGIIYYFSIFPLLDLIVQVGSKGSPSVPRFCNLLARLNDLTRFDFYPTQMEIESFDSQFWMVNFHAIAICPHIPVGAGNFSSKT